MPRFRDGPGFIERAVRWIRARSVDHPVQAGRARRGPDDLESWSGPLLNRGLLPLGGYGCALDPRLVVSGPRRGEVWIDGAASDGGFFPFTVFDTGYLHDPGRGYPETFEAMRFDHPLTFTEWYEDWLGATEAQRVGRDLRL